VIACRSPCIRHGPGASPRASSSRAFTPADAPLRRRPEAGRRRPWCRPASSTARRGRAAPGWRARSPPRPSRWLAKEVAQRVGRRACRQAEGATQTLHGELDDARRQGAAAGTDEERPVRHERIGAGGDVIRHRPRHLRQHRHLAHLAALAGHSDAARLEGLDVPSPEAERLRDAQATTVEQRHHGCIARQDPALACLTGAAVGIHHGAGRLGRQRARQALRYLRCAHGNKGRRRAEAGAFEMPAEGAQRRQLAHQRAPGDPRRAARGEEGAQVHRLQPRDGGERRRAAEVVREEGEELARVAAIGLQRLGRQAALTGKMGEPPLEGAEGVIRQIDHEGKDSTRHPNGA